MKAYNKLKKLAKDRIDVYIQENSVNDAYSIATFISVTILIVIIYFLTIF